MAARKYAAEEAVHFLFELLGDGNGSGDESSKVNDSDAEVDPVDNVNRDSDMSKRISLSQVHRQVMGVFVVFVGMFVGVEEEDNIGKMRCCSR